MFPFPCFLRRSALEFLLLETEGSQLNELPFIYGFFPSNLFLSRYPLHAYEKDGIRTRGFRRDRPAL